jgi:transposase
VDLTAEQWEVLESLIPEPPRRADRRGRPWREPRDVLSGILWVLHAGGAPSRDFPERYPPYHTCHRHFQQRIEECVLDKVLHASAVDLKERDGLELSECFVDGTFVGAKKGRIGGKEQAGQGYEAHGADRPLWSCYLRARGECFGVRGHARRSAPGGELSRRGARGCDGGPSLRLRPRWSQPSRSGA